MSELFEYILVCPLWTFSSFQVKELKDKIEADRGKDYPAAGQKLIYAGNVVTFSKLLTLY